MPTGYTADIVDGKPVTFQEFAMRCARAFAPEPELRDSPAIMESHAHSGSWGRPSPSWTHVFDGLRLRRSSSSIQIPGSIRYDA